MNCSLNFHCPKHYCIVALIGVQRDQKSEIPHHVHVFEQPLNIPVSLSCWQSYFVMLNFDFYFQWISHRVESLCCRRRSDRKFFPIQMWVWISLGEGFFTVASFTHKICNTLNPLKTHVPFFAFEDLPQCYFQYKTRANIGQNLKEGCYCNIAAQSWQMFYPEKIIFA